MNINFYKINSFLKYILNNKTLSGIVLLFIIILFSKLSSSKFVIHEELKVPKVILKALQASNHKTFITLTGHTQAFRRTILKAEISGKIAEINIEKGQFVQKGQTILTILDSDYIAKLEQAKAKVKYREAVFSAATKLKNKDFYAENNLLAAKAELEDAKANFARTNYNTDQITIKAPYDAYYDNCMAEVGNYVNVGDPVATLLLLNPIKVIGSITEADWRFVKLAQPCYIKIESINKTFSAKVTYLSQMADQKTRSYAIEITLENEEDIIPDGVTAFIEIEKEEVLTHKVPASALILDDQGVLGVMCEKDSKAYFVPITLVQASKNDLLITGPAAHIQLIVVGGEFVKTGQTVHSVEKQIP